jgi:GWxTD domain-containing protein
LQASREDRFVTAIPRVIPRAATAATPATPQPAAPFRIEVALPWLALLWLAGVAAFSLRSAAGWAAARRLRDRGVCRAPDPWPHRLRHLSARLRVAKPVALLESYLADVPVVIGYLRPVILVPAGMLAGLPAAQAEAILLHELAHIRRHDYLVNLLQTLVENCLFYHPAAWWISGVIRAERENCCDDLAVAACGNAGEYAAALTALEQTRQGADQPALAATGGSLVKRIRRLLYQPERFAFAPFLSAGILAMVVSGALVAWQAAAPAPGQQAPAARPGVSRYTHWLEEDVPYIIDDRERVAFKALHTDEERDHFIEQFWLRRDPTLGTPENEFKDEHYRRITYATSHFAWRQVPGWKTDRGRIYIVYGPPDELESHPSGRPTTAAEPATDYPVEQWLYHQLKGIGANVIVEFDDPHRNGDYRMTLDPNPGTGKRVGRP